MRNTCCKFLFKVVVGLAMVQGWRVHGDITDASVRQSIQGICPHCSQDQLVYILQRERVTQKNSVDEGGKIANVQGFLPLTAPEVPPAVRQAGRSIFQIFVISSDQSLSPRVSVRWRARFLSSLGAPANNTALRNAALAQAFFAHCQENRRSECSVPIQTQGILNVGSAFLVGPSGRQLWTANHVMGKAIRELGRGVKESQMIPKLIASKARFRIALFDGEGNLVATPWSNSIRIVGSVAKYPMGDTTPTFPPGDSLELELEKPLALPGLTSATRSVSLFDPLFHLGYPDCTGCKSMYPEEGWLKEGTRYPFLDARGAELRVTLGEVFRLRSGLISYADAATGMSGGPTLNAAGEVLGVNSMMTAIVDFREPSLPLRLIEVAPLLPRQESF